MRCFHDLVYCIFLTWQYESECDALGYDRVHEMPRTLWEYQNRSFINGYAWSLDGLQAT